ncbi:glutathione peroxidase [Moraxella macacae 0408225]|uniref:Glutathione peroxidase n=1 Tax=Moraxella macacae 0408225 TaxID=1230338 RepID=L2F9H8_9GAMM|nr:glutathione peroxidase [Moraxella macacae]ELA09692.1 glutathione peroxidase [Moraxella macacae 0408225]
MSDFYQLSAIDITGQNFEFSQLMDRVVLIVNTASKCGFTSQYQGLQALFEQYQQQGLVVIGFPCNQFGQQEPDTNVKIGEFCKLNYGVSFPMMAKINVKGDQTHPVYRFLKSQKRGKGILTDEIKWNFTKFLINRDGEVVNRYAPTTKPEEIGADIVKIL